MIDLPGNGCYLMTGLSGKGWCSACGPIVKGQQLIQMMHVCSVIFRLP